MAIDRFDGFDVSRGAFRNGLLGIVRHRALRHHRRIVPPVADAETDGPSEALPPLDLLELRERVDVVRAALVCLDSDHRRVLQDKYAEGLSVIEIANSTGRSAKTVESLLSRARVRLRELLRPYFSTPRGEERHEPIDVRPIDPDDDEQRIGRLIAEAGDTAVAPRPERVPVDGRAHRCEAF